MVTTWQIISSIVGSSVLAAIISNVQKWWNDAVNAGASKETEALYAAIVMEEFAIYCANILWDEAESFRTEGQHGHIHTELPKIVNLRTEIDVKSLPLPIRAKILTMYTKIGLDNAFIQDEYYETKVYPTGSYAADRGKDALAIADDIRGRFGKLKREKDPLFDRASDTINQEFQRLQKARKRYEEESKLAAEKKQALLNAKA